MLPLLVIALLLYLPSQNTVSIFCIYFLLSLTYHILVAIDAISVARKLGADYQPKRYNQPIISAMIFISIVTINTTVTTFIKNNYVQAYKIPAGSMKPTLIIGDHILVDRGHSARNPDRGDVIVFEYPVDPQKDFVKRIAAVGGDTVEIRDKELRVNGRPAEEAYVVHSDERTLPASQAPRDNFGPVAVPPESYFVLGDNRDESYDSRFFGSVEKAKVKGVVRNIYWSWDSEQSGVRWERVGTSIK